MSTKALLVFQGGGAMGAYQCGAYKAIADYLRQADIEVAGVAGASIGALNAGVVARHLHEEDRGAGALERFWREELAVLVQPIFPLPYWYHHCWNGLLTMLLAGHRSMSTPNYPAWGPWGAALRSRTALHDTAPMARMLERRFGSFDANPGQYPLLLVRAVNATTRQPAIFHTWQESLGVRHLMASSSIPLIYPLTDIDDESYWDGDILPYSPLRDLLQALRSRPRRDNGSCNYVVIIVDTICGEAHKPESALDLLFQVEAALLAPRADADEHYAALNNRYLDFLADCGAATGDKLPTGLTRRIARERKAAAAAGLCRLDIVRIPRCAALPFEYISRDLDYSRARVEMLIEQGERYAREVLEARFPTQ